MASWARSTVTPADLEGLVARGLLCPRTTAEEWIAPISERVPSPPPGYIISFVEFHEQGFAMPAHDFFHGLLFHYDI